MRILVTGGTGFIGSHIAKELLSRGHEVLITGTKSEQAVPGARFLNHHLTGLQVNDIGQIDVCFHQAGNNDTQDRDFKEMYHSNVTAPRTVLQRLIEGNQCKAVIYASTTAIYGDTNTPYREDTPHRPTTAYAVSKAAFEYEAEELAAKYKVPFCGLRYCNVYGEGEQHKGKRSSMIHQICTTMAAGKSPILFEPGTQSRDWCHIVDVVRANILAMQYSLEAETPLHSTFNIGSGVSFSFKKIVETVNSLLLTAIEPGYKPNPYVGTYQDFTQCDTQKAAEVLSWVPIYTPEEGIKEYFKFITMKNNELVFKPPENLY
jgi:UDP-glucose 4-epimerase